MPNSSIPKHYLYPSTLKVSKSPAIMHTILGSCVSVCLYDENTGIGGMNHFMLPFWNGNGLASPKYGNIAIDLLIKQLRNLGVKQEHIKGKVFGGGAVIDTIADTETVGERNYKYAIETLNNLNIPIISRSIGGEVGRKIIFLSSTGEVKLKYINKIGSK